MLSQINTFNFISGYFLFRQWVGWILSVGLTAALAVLGWAALRERACWTITASSAAGKSNTCITCDHLLTFFIWSISYNYLIVFLSSEYFTRVFFINQVSVLLLYIEKSVDLIYWWIAKACKQNIYSFRFHHSSSKSYQRNFDYQCGDLERKLRSAYVEIDRAVERLQLVRKWEEP